jgi:IS5 family transposase
MMLRTAERVTSLYDRMDAAYDATPIREVSEELGHKPLIERNKRRAETVPFDPAEAVRYKQRSVCERVNSRLKDEFGGRQVRVRGKDKVHLHILFGILALFADQLFQILNW